MSSITREPEGVQAGSMDPRYHFVLWRAAAWSGPIFLLALGVGWAIVAGFLPPPHESWTAVQTQHWFAHHAVRIRIGMALYLPACGLYIPWCIAISNVIERIEGRRGFLSQMEFAGGIGTTLVAMSAGLMWMMAAFRTNARSPQDIQLLMDLGWFFFNLTFAVTAAQMLAVGLAVILDRRADPLYPKWVTWISVIFVGTFIPLLLIPFVTRGPFSWGGLINYFVSLGGAFVWDSVVAFYTFGAIKKIEREELQPAR